MSTTPGPDASPGTNHAEQPIADRSSLRRARAAVSLLSVSYGVMVGGWSSRVPDIRAAVGADQSTWGIVNSVEVVAGLVVAVAMVWLISRVNLRRLALMSATTLPVVAPLAASSPTVAVLVAGVMVWGITTTLLETPTNALQLGVQAAYQRPLIGSFGACFNFGAFAGAGLGIAATALGVAAGVQIGSCSVILGAGVVVSRHWLPDEPARVVGKTHRWRLRDRLTPQLLLLVAISFLTAFMVSAGEQWSAIYTSGTLHGGTTLGAATYTGWVVGSAGGLVAVDRLTARIGLLRFFTISMVFAAASLAVALGAGSPYLALVGFVLLGLCTVGIGPLLNGMGQYQPGLSAGEALSVIQLGQPPAFLLSPIIIGFLADSHGLRIGLVSVVAALLTTAALSRWLRIPGPNDQRPTLRFRKDAGAVREPGAL